MENEIYSIKQYVKTEYEIQKSRFISYGIALSSVQQAEEEIKKIESEHAQATHVCYAYVVSGFEKCSDNGEPSGTAGKPILEVIKKNKLTNVLIVVVRYFGGIKLGAGGLVRAYSKSASLALNNNVGKLKEFCVFNTTTTLKQYNNALNAFSRNGIKVISTTFNEVAYVKIYAINEVALKNLKMLEIIENYELINKEYVSE